VISLDVILHVRDRLSFLREIARVLRPRGKFLLTDAGIITGPLSNEEVRRRSPHGFSQFVPGGWNEAAIASAGFRLLETEDRTMSAVRNASGRRASLLSRRAEWEQRSGATAFQDQIDYLDTVIEVSEKRALSRMMFLAEVS
jgi:SAM-dependent methyltransferase